MEFEEHLKILQYILKKID